jgi:pyruvate dehydrogenase (quinone)
MARTVADQMVETLSTAGVRRIYGIVGDSLNGFTDALRRHGGIDWLHVRHEEVAAFAAGADAYLTGGLAVCAGSCGPDNLHLFNGLFDCHRSRVPVVAIAAHIPSPEIGPGYFQETHPERLFRECSSFCELVSSVWQMPRALEIAIRRAIAERCVSVVVIPGDIALKPGLDAPSPQQLGLAPARSTVTPSAESIDRMAALLNSARRVTLLCGAGCEGARDQLIRLAGQLKSPIVHAMRGKRAHRVGQSFRRRYDRSDRILIRLRGHEGLRYARDAGHGLSVPSVLPRAGADRAGRPASRGHRPATAGGTRGDRRGPLDHRDIAARPEREDRQQHLNACLADYKEARKGLDDLADGREGGVLHPQHVARVISERASEDAIFTCDVGLPTVWAARYLAMNGRRRLLGSFWHGSMATALAQAIGAQAANPDRLVVSLSGDGRFTMLMGDVLTLVQLKLPVKLVVFNNGALGFIELEQKSTGFLDFGTDFVNPNFAAMAEAVGIKRVRIENPPEVDEKLAEALSYPGPVLVDAVVNRMEPCRRRLPPRWPRASHSICSRLS